MDANIENYIALSFQKIRKLKENEKGEVWLATDKSGRLVILKYIALTGLPYRILKEKNFSLCPRIYHAWEDNGKTVVVEEHVSGETLLDRIGRKEYLTEEEAQNILLELCDGLLPIHMEGVIHRDIKPSNLILQSKSVIRLIDFDASRIVKEHNGDDTTHLGTKGYAPPEQFGYGQTDERSDIYSIGVTFKKALPENYNGCLAKILAKCVEMDPNKRYQNVKELKRAIIFRARFQKWGKKLAFAAVFAILAITLNISPTVEIPKEEASEEQPAPIVVKAPVSTEKPEAIEPKPTVLPAETTKTAEPAKTVKTVEVAPIEQYTPPEILPNKAETSATETQKAETVMKCPQIIPPPKTEEKPQPNNDFVEKLEERSEEQERERQRAIVKMMLDSLPPDWPQEKRDRALKEFLKVMKFDKYP